MTPTPAHQAFREKRADSHSEGMSDSEPDFGGKSEMTISYESFLAGMEAEHEVARLMGRIEALKDIESKNVEITWHVTQEIIAKAEAQLAALLAKVEG